MLVFEGTLQDAEETKIHPFLVSADGLLCLGSQV